MINSILCSNYIFSFAPLLSFGDNVHCLVQSGRQGLLTMCVCACVCLPDRRLALVQSGRQGLLTVCVSP